MTELSIEERNEIERLYRRLKSFRRVVSHFDKLDALFTGFMSLLSLSRRCDLVLTGPSRAKAQNAAKNLRHLRALTLLQNVDNV
jgi:hypothetical protein